MAIVNTKTGFYGFTIDTTGNSSDKNGDTKTCIFAINYPLQSADVNFTISSGAEDWAAQMGDGSIIPLIQPDVIYQNRDNAIVQFTLEKGYPSNSPCFLMYRSDTATMSITARSDERPFEINSVCGYFAYTIEGNNDVKLENGYTKTLQATIPFPTQSTAVDFSISNDPSHWGVRMGDGSIIPLRDPIVLFTNQDNAVIQFTMDVAYPSNSPGVLVYRSSQALLEVHPRDDEEEFIPVIDIIGMPDNIVTRVPFKLEDMNVLPFNASIQTTVWEVVSGPAIIENNTLTATEPGVITIKCTIPKGLAEDKGYFKNFNIRAVENEITIISQPVSNINLLLNKAGDILSINATSLTTKIIRYQWYRNTTASTNGGVELDGETSSAFNIPFNRVGHFYYYCKVSADGAKEVFSNICDVYVTAEIGSIFIKNAPTQLYIEDTYTLEIDKDAAAADIPKVVWKSSDTYVANINKDTGQISVINEGTVTFTATTIDGKYSASCTVVVPPYISVTNITGLVSSIDTDTNVTLTGTIEPANATVKTIEWSIVDAKDTGAYINNGIMRSRGTGTVMVRATVRKGISIKQDFTRDFYVTINKKFIPVESVELNIPSVITAGEIVLLKSTVSPENATNNNVSYSIHSAGTTGARLNGDLLSVTAPGTVNITATVNHGTSETRDYTRTFSITIASEWVAVENIVNLPENFDPVDQPLQLSGNVYPANATMKNISYKIKSSPLGARLTLNLQNQLEIDYEHVTWWNRNPNPTPPDYFDQWLPNITDPIVIEMRVTNGISSGVDFVSTASINIVSPASPDIFVAVTGVKMELPSIVRAHRPIPMSHVKVEPFNATGQTIEIAPIRANDPEFMGGLCAAFRPSEESPSYWKNNYNIDMDEEYDWTQDCYYLYNYEDGVTKFVYTVLNGVEVSSAEEDSNWHGNNYVTFLPAYMAVKDITNIPEVIYANREDNSYVLDPHCHTNIPITAKQTNTYDEEVPSYTDVKWIMTDRGTTRGTSISTDGIITIGEDDVGSKFKIRAEVEQGTHEAYTWYEREFNAVSYYQEFEISIEEDPNKDTASDDDPLVKLKLKDNTVVPLKWLSQLSKLCNHKPATFDITIENKTFKKSDITEVEFWAESTGLNEVPTSLRSFGCNFTSLTKIDRIPSTITGDQCLMYFLEGCTKFNQEITIPTRVNGDECLHAFLKGCTLFNSNITIPNGITGRGAMKRFLVGCINFNQPLALPSTLTGEQCLMRFLEGCTKFNQTIDIPSGVKGDRCLDHFMFGCKAFNKAITIPNAIEGVANMRGFMRDTWAMISTVTISLEAAEKIEINGLTFGCFERGKSTYENGITVAGSGADKFKEVCPSATNTLPVRKFK